MRKLARISVLLFAFFSLAAFTAAQEPRADASPSPSANPDPSPGTEAEENLDDLFNSPAGDSVSTDTGINHRSQFEKKDGIQLTGDFKVAGGAAAGWTSMPVFSNLEQDFDPNFGLVASTAVYLDARPDEDFRAYCSLSSTVDPSKGGHYTWTSFSIGELFCDYTLADAIYFRAGRFGNTWGQGRIFSSVDVISDIGSLFALRATLPAALQGMNTIIGIDSEYAPVGTTQGLSRALIGAARADMVFGGLLIGLGARCQYYDGVDGAISLKKVAFGTDFLADALVHYANGAFSFKAVAGFFREWNDLKLNVEYFYDSSSVFTNDHRIGIEIGFKKIFGSGIDIGARCLHAFSDNSGSDVFGLSFSPWSRVSIAFALPFSYGPDGGIFVSSNVNDEMSNYRIGVGMKIELKGKY